MRWSSSMAMTSWEASRSLRVRFPVPGPISRTVSVGFIADFLTIVSRIRGFVRMCWPLLL